MSKSFHAVVWVATSYLNPFRKNWEFKWEFFKTLSMCWAQYASHPVNWFAKFNWKTAPHPFLHSYTSAHSRVAWFSLMTMRSCVIVQGKGWVCMVQGWRSLGCLGCQCSPNIFTGTPTPYFLTFRCACGGVAFDKCLLRILIKSVISFSCKSDIDPDWLTSPIQPQDAGVIFWNQVSVSVSYFMADISTQGVQVQNARTDLSQARPIVNSKASKMITG